MSYFIKFLWMKCFNCEEDNKNKNKKIHWLFCSSFSVLCLTFFFGYLSLWWSNYFILVIFILNILETHLEQEVAINKTIDWLLVGANVDFISTESGNSEFTHPNCTLMLVCFHFKINLRFYFVIIWQNSFWNNTGFFLGLDEYGNSTDDVLPQQENNHQSPHFGGKTP